MRVFVGLCVLAATSGATAKERLCVVEGRAVEPFFVSVISTGGPTLKVRVQGVAATVKLPEKPGPAAVEVRGSLLFAGTTPVEKLPLKPKEAVDASNGLVRLGAGAGLLEVHTRRKWVEGDLVLSGVRFKNLLFPCEGLTLDPVAATSDAAPADVADEGWIARGKKLTLRSDPGAGITMEVVLEDPNDLELHSIEHSGAWLRVSSRFPDGSSVTGWAKASELVRPARRGESGDLPPVAASCTRVPTAKPGTQLATATVTAGTPVSFDRLFPWATVRGTDPLTVRYTPGESWVELVGVPGLAGTEECPDNGTTLDEAWVPRTTVQLPAAAAGAPADSAAKK